MTEEERRSETRQMLILKQAGASYRAIADKFQLSVSEVWRRIKNELDNTPLPEATQLRALEVLKLDEYERRLQPAISDGDTKAISQAVRISERRCKMLGLDLPIRNEVVISSTEQMLANEIVKAVERAATINTAETSPTPGEPERPS